MSTVVNLDSQHRKASCSSALAPMPPAPIDRILRLPQVTPLVGLSRASIYRRIATDDFPAQVSLGGKSVGWRESAISTWIAERGAGRTP